MKIYYNDGTDLLYLRFDARKQQVENRRVTDDIVIDIGQEGKIVGTEILDASQNVTLQTCCPYNELTPRAR